ncbi:hypothetical protein GCM10023063_37190 [Arthrobacter methylotrophus]|uniref:hypothetical protein n=1 Tax=Arthrobacter methylotrophus TaxID=121291 RepID=UPI0031F1B09D
MLRRSQCRSLKPCGQRRLLPSCPDQRRRGILPDGTRLPDHTPLKDVPNNGGQGHVDWLRAATPDREPTLADLAQGRLRRG